jgi:tetratricopeptide (TPR) repeat protein
MYFTYNGGPVFARNLGAHADIAAADAAASSPEAMTADALARRGEASLSRGDLAGALADLDRACTLEPTAASHFWARARVRLAMDQPEAARADIDAALKLNPALAEARIMRAALHEQAQQHELALEDLATLDKTLPPQSDIRRGMAMFYEGANLPAQALAQWNLWMPAHRHDIAREHALNSRCWNRVQLDIELDKALDDCDGAIDLDSKNGAYLDSRAWVYLRLGKPQKSLSDFDRSLAIDPKHVWSLYGRGQANLALGRIERGQADLALARKQQPDIDQAAKRSGLPVAPPPAPSAASTPAS